MSIATNAGVVPEWTIGDRMRKALEHAGVSVQEMADYLDVNRGTVGRWVNGHTAPSKMTCRLWALRTGVPLAWLETGTAPAHDGGPAPSRYTSRDLNPEPADFHEYLVRAGRMAA